MATNDEGAEAAHEYAKRLDIAGLRWDAGAPEPFVLATEQRTLFSFWASTDEGDERAVAELVGCTSVTFGFPNDEVQHGHRLFANGLEFYQLHEVHNSAWLRELRGVERHHPASSAKPFVSSRHFILLFHDSTLEAIANDVVGLATFDSQADAMTFMRTEIGN